MTSIIVFAFVFAVGIVIPTAVVIVWLALRTSASENEWLADHKAAEAREEQEWRAQWDTEQV